MLLNLNESYIYYDDATSYVKDYYDYIMRIIIEVLINHKLNLNILFGNVEYNFNNSNKTIKININYEHTLVKIGGRGVSPNCYKGNVLSKNFDPYLVRIEMYEKIKDADIIIDYSIPNIYNIYRSNNYGNFYKKLLYISPVIYHYDIPKLINNNRQINLLTTFINVEEPRRKEILYNIKLNNFDHININNCFDSTQLEELYLNTKIIINIHQTNSHRTFEELRCLPALLSGVIVISEEVPINNLVPYNDLIIWSSYDNIIETARKVIDNYDYYFNKIFKLKNVLSDLHKNNIEKMTNKLT